jgi:2-polyprenyl-3-methyl-5-hydroxy-6-metoxy-1,4-benzoquinol methylase
MVPVGASDWLWKEETGFYSESAEELLRRPYLPDERFVQDRRLIRVLRRYGNLSQQSRVLEIGCGRSPWLPYLARTIGCEVVGLELEPHAAELARANLAGAHVEGTILCRDAFDAHLNADLSGHFDLVFSLGVVEHLPNVTEQLRVLAGYLKPGGRLLTLVPNLQGMNWAIQKLASQRVLDAHVIYTRETLRAVHEEAGFRNLAADYLGFWNSFLTSSLGERSPKQRMHYLFCRSLALAAAAWGRMRLPMPEWRWLAPLVFVIATPSGAQAPRPSARVNGARSASASPPYHAGLNRR